MVQVVQPSVVEGIRKEQLPEPVAPPDAVASMVPVAGRVATAAPAREGNTLLPLSEGELAKVERTATVRRPVHWEMVTRLVAEVRGYRAEMARREQALAVPPMVAGRLPG